MEPDAAASAPAPEEAAHDPVLLKETLEALHLHPGSVVVDATLGRAGHALAILERIGDEGLLVGLDRDPHALAAAEERLRAAAVSSDRFTLICADHRRLSSILADALADRSAAPDAILLDLGPSTPQLLNPERGFSWTSETALDMRMTPDEGPSAADLVAEAPEAELTRIFRENADERWAKAIAKAIVRTRQEAPIRTGRALAALVEKTIPRGAWPPKIHPATRVFLALRIEVNGELEGLVETLPQAFDALKSGGRLAVISFHSGEDRIVKRWMRTMTTAPAPPWPLPQGNDAAPAPARTVIPGGAAPSAEEIDRNPRSRSARLRAIEKS